MLIKTHSRHKEDTDNETKNTSTRHNHQDGDNTNMHMNMMACKKKYFIINSTKIGVPTDIIEILVVDIEPGVTRNMTNQQANDKDTNMADKDMDVPINHQASENVIVIVDNEPDAI